MIKLFAFIISLSMVFDAHADNDRYDHIKCRFSVIKLSFYENSIKNQTIGVYKFDFHLNSKPNSAKINNKKIKILDHNGTETTQLSKNIFIKKKRWNLHHWGLKRSDHFKIKVSLSKKEVQNLTKHMSPSTAGLELSKIRLDVRNLKKQNKAIKRVEISDDQTLFYKLSCSY